MNNVLNTAYNNYLTTYTPKTLTRYDTHKKSELRNVYNSIVKMNKDEPWYLPTTSKATQNYAVDLKENARMLHNTIAQLGGLEKDGLLSKKSAFSSNEDVVSATYIGGEASDSISEFSVEVKSLASPQENMGLFLENESVDLESGTYSFDLSINDMNYEFQFAVGEEETNKDVQSRLVRLINNSGIGIKSSLIESEGKTALRLTSESTGLSLGKSEIFHISDDHTSKNSGTVEYFGLDYVSRQPSNARFLLDGEERIVSSNHFTLGKVYEVEFKGISEENDPVTIGLKADVDSLTDNMTQLIGGYNSFMKAASSYLETQSKSSELVKEMKGIVSLYSSPMESMGLKMSDDGTLRINNDMMKRAASQASNVTETFSYMKDFSNSLLRKSDQISLNPMNYVDKTMVAYKNPKHNFVSPYTTSAYSGMMFNGYC